MPVVDSAKPARLLPQIVLLHMILPRPVSKHVIRAQQFTCVCGLAQIVHVALTFLAQGWLEPLSCT